MRAKSVVGRRAGGDAGRLRQQSERVPARAEPVADRQRPRRRPRSATDVDPTPTGQIARPIANLYTDQTVSRVGDIVTVIISINDKAQFGNATDRSKTADVELQLELGLHPGGSSVGGGVAPATSVTLEQRPRPRRPRARATSTARSRSRSRWRRWSPRCCRTAISSSAARRRCASTTNCASSPSPASCGPSDISRANTISYDRVAEARISYGGRGRLSEVQQPSWGQEI